MRPARTPGRRFARHPSPAGRPPPRSPPDPPRPPRPPRRLRPPRRPPAAAPAPAAAAPPERPLAEVVQVDAGATCLDAELLTLRIARWRERDTVDARIRIVVHGDARSPTHVSFTVTEQDGGHAERTLD